MPCSGETQRWANVGAQIPSGKKEMVRCQRDKETQRDRPQWNAGRVQRAMLSQNIKHKMQEEALMF